MKKEELLKAMSEIDSELLKSSEYKKNSKGWVKWAVLAAGLGLALLVATSVEISPREDGEAVAVGSQQEEKQGSEKENQTDSELHEDNSLREEEAKVDESSNIESMVNGAQEVAYGKKITIAGYDVFYERLDGIKPAVLAANRGNRLGNTNCYYFSGHEEAQYLMEWSGGSYYLWKFSGCGNENYSYSDILSIIYGIDSYEDIAKIVVRPTDDYHTGEWIRFKAQIGEKEITEESEIKAFYEILSAQICNGPNSKPVNESQGDTIEDMREAITKVRFFTIETTQGDEIDDLRYTARSDSFYHDNGVIFEPLAQEQAQAMEELLGIQ